MSHRLLADLERRLDNWRETLWDTDKRIDDYQRDLLACRRCSPRPRSSIKLALAMCASARRQRHQAASCVVELRRDINNLTAQ